jgi:hypothetical protein
LLETPKDQFLRRFSSSDYKFPVKESSRIRHDEEAREQEGISKQISGEKLEKYVCN